MSNLTCAVILVCIASVRSQCSQNVVNNVGDFLLKELIFNSPDFVVLPEVTEQFLYNRASVNAKNGSINGLYSIKRYGDISLEVINDTVDVNLQVTFDYLAVKYDYYKVKLLGLTSEGTLDAAVENLIVSVSTTMGQESLCFLTINSIKFLDMDNLKIKMRSGCKVCSKFISAVATRVGNFFKGRVRSLVEAQLNTSLKKILKPENFMDTEAVTPACILALEDIFVKSLKEKQMCTRQIEDTDSAEYKYRSWMQECYEETWEKLLNILRKGKLAVKLQALVTLFKLSSAEGNNPLKKKKPKKHPFPVHRLKQILEGICSNEKDVSNLIDRMKEYLQFKDVQYFLWKAMEPILTQAKKPEDHVVRNILKILEAVPKEKQQEEAFLCDTNNSLPDEDKKNATITNVWTNISKWQYTRSTHRLLLLALIEHFMPRIAQPIFLTDYLMDSMDVGGAVSVLALQGILTLISKHNIDYPDIYGKLYSMFTPDIFSMKYKARLFYLADIFLSSTHLPEALVAAFAKRLARLSLNAPPQDILIIIPFIGNLILRHKGLQKLINNPGANEVVEDPYLMDEKDPYASHALDSSLWEIQTLQSHVLFRVCASARFINNTLPSVEWNLSSLLENTSDKIFLSELKKKQKVIPVTFEKPASLSLPKTESFIRCWNLL